MHFIIRVLNYLLNIARILPSKVRYISYCYKHGLKTDFFRGVDTILYGAGIVKIGVDSYCGDRCAFQLALGRKIIIGNNVSISHNVRIYTETNDTKNIISGSKERERIYGDVEIGNNVWIGANVFINPGISIGDNVVIGANSVLTKSIPSGVVAAGCPAKVIKISAESSKS